MPRVVQGLVRPHPAFILSCPPAFQGSLGDDGLGRPPVLSLLPSFLLYKWGSLQHPALSSCQEASGLGALQGEGPHDTLRGLPAALANGPPPPRSAFPLVLHFGPGTLQCPHTVGHSADTTHCVLVTLQGRHPHREPQRASGKGATELPFMEAARCQLGLTVGLPGTQVAEGKAQSARGRRHQPHSPGTMEAPCLGLGLPHSSPKLMPPWDQEACQLPVTLGA